jgi:hypothetical protein
MAIGYHYEGEKQDVGLLGYLATNPAYQGMGYGRKMDAHFRETALHRAQQNGHELGGIFLECNLPGTEPDVMDPVVRIAMYKKWGAAELPIFYKQPPLEKGADGLELRLLVEPHPVTGKYPTMAAIKGYLNGIYTELQEYAGCPPEKNPDYLKSMQQLDKLGDAGLAAFYKNTLKGREGPPASAPVRKQRRHPAP